LVLKFRPDLGEKFAHLLDDPINVVAKYVFHVNAQTPPTGEQAFASICADTGGVFWAKDPMIDRCIIYRLMYQLRLFMANILGSIRGRDWS